MSWKQTKSSAHDRHSIHALSRRQYAITQIVLAYCTNLSLRHGWRNLGQWPLAASPPPIRKQTDLCFSDKHCQHLSALVGNCDRVLFFLTFHGSWFHGELGEVENKCISHNFSLFAISLPKIIIIGGNLTKFRQKQFCTVFWDTVYLDLYSGRMRQWGVLTTH